MMVTNLIADPMSEVYIEKVSREAGISFDAAKEEMQTLREEYGMSYRQYYDRKLHSMRKIQKDEFCRGYKANREAGEAHLQNIMEATGLSRAAAMARFRAMKYAYPQARLTYAYCDEMQLCRLSKTELKELMEKVIQRNALKEELLIQIERIDKGELSYRALSPNLRRLRRLIEDTTAPGVKENVLSKMSIALPDMYRNPRKRRRIMIDAIITSIILNFKLYEYFMYKLWDKSIKKRRTFLSNYERMFLINLANHEDELTDKYKSYCLLKECYKRKVMHIGSDDDREEFVDFCKDIKEFVIKPTNLSFGRGIKLIKTEPNRDLTELFEFLRREYDEFVIEERIIQSEAMAMFNPDSVNTVRVCTYFGGKTYHIVAPFMKVGRSGHFVDNGGAGGILAGIDGDTGRIFTDGVDEAAIFYDRHPDSGIVFKGHALPEWEKARELAFEAAAHISGARFIGWDLAYSKTKGWLIVEGNFATQFVGQQAPSGIGIKQQMIELFDYKGNFK